jgi:hypothetical protein
MENIFEEKPIQLVSDTFDLQSEGIEFLQKLSDKKVAIITIIGTVYSGKSFLSSQLIGRNNQAFAIGGIDNRVQTCTKGIWVWGKPIIKDDTYVLILDSEGFITDSDEKRKDYDQKMFILCNLISSSIVFNIKKKDTDSEDNISDEMIKESCDIFNKLIEGVNKVKLENENIPDEKNKLTNNDIPKIFWLNRDYDIKDMSKYNEKYDLNDNEIYQKLYKKNIQRYCLPFPTSEEADMLINLYLTEPDNPFIPEFTESLNQFRKLIIEDVKPKSINGIQLNGQLFYGVLQEITTNISNNDSCYLISSLKSALYSSLNDISENILNKFRNKFTDEIDKNVNIYEKIKNSYEEIIKEIQEVFPKSYIGQVLKSNFLTEILSDIFSFANEDIDNSIKESINNFEEKIKNINENETKKQIENIQKANDINIYLKNFTSGIRDNLNKDLFNEKTQLISSFPLIKEYIENICKKIDSYSDNISNYVDVNLKKLENYSINNQNRLDEKINEIKQKDSEIIELKIKIENLTTKIDEKEKENLNNIEIENEKQSRLEKRFKEQLEEKDNIIKELESKVANLNKELSSLNTESTNKNNEIINIKKELEELKEKNNEIQNKEKINEEIKKEDYLDSKNQELKNLLSNILNSYSEYAEIVGKLEENKNLIFRNKFIEETKNFVENSSKNMLDELSIFKEKHFKTMTDNYEKEISKLKNENLNLTSELEKTNLNLKELKNESEILENKLKNIESNKENEQFTNENKDNVIQTQKETLEFCKASEKELREQYENNVIKLSECISESKMKEDELELITFVMESIFKKDKSSFERNLTKLSPQTKEKIRELNKKYKFIK